MKVRDKVCFPVTRSQIAYYGLHLMYTRNTQNKQTKNRGWVCQAILGLLLLKLRYLLFLGLGVPFSILKWHYFWPRDSDSNYLVGPGFFEWIVIDDHLISTVFDINILGYVGPVQTCRLLVGHNLITPADRFHNYTCSTLPGTRYTYTKRRKGTQKIWSTQKICNKGRDPVGNYSTDSGHHLYLNPFCGISKLKQEKNYHTAKGWCHHWDWTNCCHYGTWYEALELPTFFVCALPEKDQDQLASM